MDGGQNFTDTAVFDRRDGQSLKTSLPILGPKHGCRGGTRDVDSGLPPVLLCAYFLHGHGHMTAGDHLFLGWYFHSGAPGASPTDPLALRPLTATVGWSRDGNVDTTRRPQLDSPTSGLLLLRPLPQFGRGPALGDWTLALPLPLGFSRVCRGLFFFHSYRLRWPVGGTESESCRVDVSYDPHSVSCRPLSWAFVPSRPRGSDALRHRREWS